MPVPTIMSIPLALADFLVSARCMPWELHQEVQRLVQTPENMVAVAMTELVCLWAMAAAQLNDGNPSIISMDLDPAQSSNPLFLDWAQGC